MFALCLFLCISKCVYAYQNVLKIDDSCVVDQVPGVCKTIYECFYAWDLQTTSQIKPQLCRYQGRTQIACCPTNPPLHNRGVFKNYFSSSNDGIIRSEKMTCRYQGELPLICCENKKEVQFQSEAQGCPPLPRPEMNRRIQHVAWRKCLEYRRYANICQLNKTTNLYERVDGCHIPDNHLRIVGGRTAGKHEFPHMALIGCHTREAKFISDVIWVAGGSLISDKFVLTAAHVLSEPTHGPVKYVVLGSINKTDTSEGILFNVIRLIPHKQNDPNTKMHDIALLELDRRVALSEFIRPACLYVPGLELKPYRIIAGWGGTKSEKSSVSLMSADIYEVPGSECKKRLKIEGFQWNSETMICAGGNTETNMNRDSCQGDSGGPLMAQLRSIKCTYAIRGIVSWGLGCGVGEPGSYTNVSYYLDWIVDNVWPDPKLNYNL